MFSWVISSCKKNRYEVRKRSGCRRKCTCAGRRKIDKERKDKETNFRNRFLKTKLFRKYLKRFLVHANVYNTVKGTNIVKDIVQKERIFWRAGWRSNLEGDQWFSMALKAQCKCECWSRFRWKRENCNKDSSPKNLSSSLAGPQCEQTARTRNSFRLVTKLFLTYKHLSSIRVQIGLDIKRV